MFQGEISYGFPMFEPQISFFFFKERHLVMLQTLWSFLVQGSVLVLRATAAIVVAPGFGFGRYFGYLVKSELLMSFGHFWLLLWYFFHFSSFFGEPLVIFSFWPY